MLIVLVLPPLHVCALKITKHNFNHKEILEFHIHSFTIERIFRISHLYGNMF